MYTNPFRLLKFIQDNSVFRSPREVKANCLLQDMSFSQQ